MKYKVVFKLVLFTLLLSLVLSACTPAAPTGGAPAGEEQPPAGENKSGEKVKLRGTVWVGQAELDALTAMTNEYLKTHTDVEVEWINISGGGQFGRDKLQTMIAGNDAPDIMMLNTGQFEGLAARNILLDLGPFAEQENFDMSKFWEIGVEGVKYDGKLYGLPRDISDVVLFYNKDLFDAAGLEYPTSDWTFDDLLAAAEKLTVDKDGDGNIDQWGFAVNNIVWAWANFVWANGGEVLSPDRKECKLTDPKSIEALEFYYEKLGKFSPPPGALPEQAWSGDWMVTQATAMGVFGPWFRPDLVNMENKFNWDVALLPVSPTTKERASVAYTDMWGIYAQTKHADEAWEFVKYLTSKEGQELWVELIGARSISPIKEVAQTDEWMHYGGSSGELILEELAVSRVPPVNFANANEVETLWDTEFGAVIAGEKNVKEAAQAACEFIAPVLAESK